MIPDRKYLNKVYLTREVYMSCLQHALSTEKEEVMGLLLGEVDENKAVSFISACLILHRTDKQPDRVEISPEQLCTASEYAEKLAKNTGRPIRVLGWYHSHPHITVWPSHVDVRTQGMYQMMDPLFVGLIFSVYQNNAGSVGSHTQVTCFQTMKTQSEYQRREIELQIIPSNLQLFNLENAVNLARILSQEEGLDDQVDYNKDPLAKLHNEAYHTLALIHIVSKVDIPSCEDLERRLNTVKLRIKELTQIKNSM